MNVKKCANGHFFDADKYQLCPHCGASTELTPNTEQQETHEKKDKQSPKKKREESTGSIIRPMPQKTMGKTFGIFDEPDQPTRPVKSVRVTAGFNPAVKSEDSKELRPCPKCGKNISAKSRFCKYCGSSLLEETTDTVNRSVRDRDPSTGFVTSVSEVVTDDQSEQIEVKKETSSCPFCGKEILEDDVFCIYCGKSLTKTTNSAFDAGASEVAETPSVLEEPTYASSVKHYEKAVSSEVSVSIDQDDETENKPSSVPASPSLEVAVKNAVSGNDGKTIGFFSMGSSNETNADVDPVVGWLVCIKGKHFGESFSIAAGRNSVGRGTSNKIVICNDNSVSREKHTWITYDPKHRVFFIQPGESSGLSYLNGETVMETKKMVAKDKIEIGDGMYLLISLCDESFSWEDYMN